MPDLAEDPFQSLHDILRRTRSGDRRLDTVGNGYRRWSGSGASSP
jgi:hypothetical protein